jgi:hypothetical protein
MCGGDRSWIWKTRIHPMNPHRLNYVRDNHPMESLSDIHEYDLSDRGGYTVYLLYIKG